MTLVLIYLAIVALFAAAIGLAIAVSIHLDVPPERRP